MTENKFPAGWDEKRVRDLIAHYDSQTEDEQADEIEDALEAEGYTLMSVPHELVDQVRALIAKQKKSA